MTEEKILDSLQEEIKLMKGELKQSLTSIRDYLLNMELPASEISSTLSELGDESQKVTMSSNLGTPVEYKPSQTLESAAIATEDTQSFEDKTIPEGDDPFDLEEPKETAEDEAETAEDYDLPVANVVTPLKYKLPTSEETIEENTVEPIIPEPEMLAED